MKKFFEILFVIFICTFYPVIPFLLAFQVKVGNYRKYLIFFCMIGFLAIFGIIFAYQLTGYYKISLFSFHSGLPKTTVLIMISGVIYFCNCIAFWEFLKRKHL